MSIDKICRAPECKNLVSNKKRSLCAMHRSRWERHKSFDEPIRTKNLKCTIEGCDKDAIGRKVCNAHRALFKRKGSYEYDNPRPEIPEGYVKFCQKHGFLLPKEIKIENKRKHCIECQRLCKKKSANKPPKKIGITRLCTSCKFEKDLSSFTPYHQIYRWPRCKDCNCNTNNVRYTRYKHHYKRKYNMTPEQFNEILINQNYLCAICNRTAQDSQPGKNKHKSNNLSVDHCHKLEKEGVIAIRGLLCFACNSILGKFKDDINLFERAIEYLKKESLLITKKPQ